MKKSVLILVSSVVLFSLFNTTETNFKLWNSPAINTDHLIAPDIPISFDTDISLFGLFINFFSDLDLDYSMNNNMTNIISQDIAEVPESIKEEVTAPIVKEAVKEEVTAPIVKEAVKEEVTAPIVKEVVKEEVTSPIVKEVVKEEVTSPIVKEVVKEEVAVPIVKEVVEEEIYIKSDEENIRDNSQIKENAKELILESLKNAIITMDDVVNLLSEHAGKEVKKKHVKKLIKSKKK